MRVSGVAAIAAAALALFSGEMRAAEPVAVFDAAETIDPASADWTAASDRGRAETARTGFGDGKAWRIEDDDGDGAEDRYYHRQLSDEQRDAARREGFTLRWRLRIPVETEGATRAIETEACVSSRGGADILRFNVQMGREGNDLIAAIMTGTAGRIESALEFENADDFHDWALLFDPESNLINLTVDGILLLAAPFDQRDRGHDLVFGSRATGTGTGDWQQVGFSIGLPDGHEMIVPPDPPFQTEVFISGEGGYDFYRIPALVVTPAGTAMVFCEARKASRSDDGDIDLLVRRSRDGGQSWLDPQLIIEEGGDAHIKFGNPTPVVDRETGTVWLAVNRDYLDERGARQGGSLVLIRSDDDGETWSAPIDITDRIKQPDWGHYAFGPGIGIQLEHGPQKGRLLLPANYRKSFNKRQPSWSHVIYSDDHGESWNLGGQLGDFTNECQVVETLENGEPGLLFNARNHWGRAGQPDKSGFRLVARSEDGGLTWSEEEMDPALSDPPCQASLFRYSWPDQGDSSRILFTNPAGRSRARLTIRLSFDEGHTWPVKKLVYGGSAAYSCMARLPDGKIGIIYEKDNYGKLTFTSFPLDWLLGSH